MKRNIARIMVIMAAISLLTAPAMATVIFSDNFDDNNRDGWYATSGKSVDTSSGYMATVSSGYPIWGVAANFSAVDLSVAGNYIKLTLDFQILEDLGGDTVTMGLWNSNGSQLTADTADYGASANDSGYYVYNRGEYLKSGVPQASSWWLKRGDSTGLGSVNGTSSLAKKTSPFWTADSTWHTFSLTVTNNGSGLIVSQVTDEGLASELTISAGDTTGNITSIDQVAIQAIRQDFAIDNVVVTSNIPEPTTLGLVSFVGLSILVIRRQFMM